VKENQPRLVVTKVSRDMREHLFIKCSRNGHCPEYLRGDGTWECVCGYVSGVWSHAEHPPEPSEEVRK